MKNKTLLVLMVVLGLGLAGCASESEKPADVTDGTGQGTEPTTAGAGDQSSATGAPLDSGKMSNADLLSKHRVYFAFDSSTVDDESRSIIEAHAAYLAANPKTKVVLEGHTDERGTREYNLALGERRAQSVMRMMRTLGVAADRMKATSYGEEKPVATGHDESSWHLNRRVEIQY
jgi:peptidoglycan-associated lipoprotein